MTLEGHGRPVNGVAALSADRVLSCSEDKSVKVWNATTGSCISTLTGHKDSVLRVGKCGPEHVFMSSSNDKTVKVWDSQSGRCLATLEGHEGAVWGIATLGQTRVASGSGDKTVKVW